MRTALPSLPSASPTENRSASSSASDSASRPAAGRAHLRPARQAQRAYVRGRFIAGWCAINPAVGRAIRRHRARTETAGQPQAPLSLLRALAVS
jgi:hypothetical protein